MKKLYSLLLALLVSTTLQAYDAYIDGIYYNFHGDEAEVTYEWYNISIVLSLVLCWAHTF